MEPGIDPAATTAAATHNPVTDPAAEATTGMDNLPSILFPLRMVQLDLYPDWHHPGADLVEFKSSDFSSVERRRTYDARAATSNGFAFEPQNSTTLLLGGTQGALFKGLATIGIKNISDPDYD